MAEADRRRAQGGWWAALRGFLAYGKTHEILGVLAAALALFGAAGLASFDPRDPSYFRVGVGEEGRIHNWGGRLGAEFTGDLLGLLGLSALLVPPLLAVLAWMGITGRRPPRQGARAAAVAVFVPSLSLLASLLGDLGILANGRVERPGGFLGDGLSRQLRALVGPAGLYLGAITGLLVAGLLFTERRLTQLPLTPLQGLRGWPLLAAQRAAGAARWARGGARYILDVWMGRRAVPPMLSAPAAPAARPAAVIEAPTVETIPPAEASTERDEEVRRVRDRGKRETGPKGEQGAFAFLGPPQAYQAPPLSLLDRPSGPVAGPSKEEQQGNAEILEKTLRDFGVEARVAGVFPGPVITRYEIEPAPGVKIQRIVALADDLALALKAMSVRVVAPIPGKAAVGVEIPNRQRATVFLKEVLASREFRDAQGLLPLALGKEIEGSPYVAELAQMPHVLIAGATGSGKSVCINALVLSLLYRSRPEEVRLVLIDPKRVELSLFNGIPHLVDRVVVDAKDAARRLQRVVAHMEERYRLFAQVGARNLVAFNALVTERAKAGGGGTEAPPLLSLPMLVVVIDELADLMLVSPAEVETAIQRIAQLARAVGIHLVVATQRPSVDVITGIIKANLPARMSFQVSSKVDSRTILDMNGAEQLLGMGDMLFIPPASSKPIRIHGCKVTEMEVRRVVEFLSRQAPAGEFVWKLLPEAATPEESEGDGEGDGLYQQAVDLVVQTRQASISMLQRRLRVGFNRAARMIERMEQEGIVSPPEGAKPREVLREAEKP